MKRLTLHTSKYICELEHFASDVAMPNLCVAKNLPTTMYRRTIKFAWEMSAHASIVHALLLLLYKLAMHENPVYRHSPKLRDLADGLIDTPLHKHDTERLASFLRKNRELHIDGYITFRMEEYKEKLDMMLYTLMKKINLNK